MRNGLPTPSLPSAPSKSQSGEAFQRATPGSQTLERGLALLRVFLGGAVGLSNAEIAQRTGLPRPTVTRLTRSLVDEGFLLHDPTEGVYGLAPVCLSLAAAYRQGHYYLAASKSMLQEAATSVVANVSLITTDRLHVLYVDSVRPVDRHFRSAVGAGFRIPIDEFVSGHALLAAMDPMTRARLLDQLARARGEKWLPARRRIDQSLRQFAELGYCTGPSAPGLLAAATAFSAPDGAVFGLVMTGKDGANVTPFLDRVPPALLDLTERIRNAWESA